MLNMSNCTIVALREKLIHCDFFGPKTRRSRRVRGQRTGKTDSQGVRQLRLSLATRARRRRKSMFESGGPVGYAEEMNLPRLEGTLRSKAGIAEIKRLASLQAASVLMLMGGIEPSTN